MTTKLLVIDDEEIERTALRQILAVEPHWIITEATDGQQALDLLTHGHHPHLCLVDLRMPTMDGLDFLRHVRTDEKLRDLKVMVASGTRDRDTVVELAKLRIEGYLLKPFDAARTLAALRPLVAAIKAADASAILQDLLAHTALIVDDDAVARTALRGIIAQEPNWNIIEATGAEAALDALRRRRPPNVCFMDLNMPGMDGLSLLREIRADPKLEDLRIAITSAAQDREKIRALAQLKIAAYLLKPLEAVKVHALLRATVG